MDKLISLYYNTYIDLCKINIENMTNKQKGLLLELYIALKNNSYLYEDLPREIKDKYKLPKHDEGIDIVKIDDKNNIIWVAQCKNYNGYLSHHQLGTFYNQLRILNENQNKMYHFNNGNYERKIILNFIENDSIKKYLIVGENTRCPHDLGIKSLKITNKNLLLLYNSTIVNVDIDNVDINIINNIGVNNINSTNTNIINNVDMTNINTINNVDVNNINTINNVDKIIMNNMSLNNINLINSRQLRNYQIECLRKLDQHTSKTFIMSLPCGTGKTVIFTEYIKQHINEKFIIIVPLINIAINLKDKYFGDDANYIWTNTNIDNNSNISIYVYDSFKKYFNNQSFNDYTLIIDEAHHIYKPSYYCLKNDSDESNYEFIEKLEQSFKKIIAVSATIEDADYQYNINDAIKNRFISDFRIDINFLPTNDNEFYLINAIEHYKYRLIFCNTIENANNIKIILNKYISSQINIIDANTKQEDRIKIIDEFQHNEDNIIISINTLNEGVDIPCAESCIFIDDRSSPVNIIQCMGRVMRNYPGKLYGKIVLFANCEDNAEKKYYKYINAINLAYNIDVNELKSKIRLFYDYPGYNINNINKCNDLIFNQIIRYNFTFEEQIQLAKIFYEKYKRLPKEHENIKFDKDNRFYDIYYAIIRAKHHKTKLYYEFLKIFGDLNVRHIFNGDPIEVCKLFKQEFNRHPCSTDISYYDLNIYAYYCRVKNCNSPELKAKLIEIFGDFSENINTRVNIDNKNHNNLIELTKKYIQNFGQVEPNSRLLIDSTTGLKCDANDVNKVRYGHIINEMKNGRKYQSIKDEINALFGNILIKNNPEQEYIDKCNDIINLYLDKVNNVKWDNVKFTVENESLLNLKYTVKQLNTFIAHTRENANACKKFNEYMKNQNVDFKLMNRQSKNEALKEQIRVIGKYYLQYKMYPKQQGKDENEILMKKLKSRKDSDKYFKMIESCTDENDLMNKINGL